MPKGNFIYKFNHPLANVTVRANDESIARHKLYRMGMALDDSRTCKVESNDPKVTSGDPFTDRLIDESTTEELRALVDYTWDDNDMMVVA
jgi:hypothetical protein